MLTCPTKSLAKKGALAVTGIVIKLVGYDDTDPAHNLRSENRRH